jgi:hypothetical protein
MLVLLACAAVVNAESVAVKKQYDVAAFVWPSYHPDDRAKVFWPMGIGEWETVMKNAPANFEQALRLVKKFVDDHPRQAPLITLNSWNEWTETSYLEPCTKYGYGYLEAVKKVFVDENR